MNRRLLLVLALLLGFVVPTVAEVSPVAASVGGCGINSIFFHDNVAFGAESWCTTLNNGYYQQVRVTCKGGNLSNYQPVIFYGPMVFTPNVRSSAPPWDDCYRRRLGPLIQTTVLTGQGMPPQ